jgi:hypothetical protein
LFAKLIHGIDPRSESVVTVTGVTSQRRACQCAERVTVNGQHHCCDAASEADAHHARYLASPIVEATSPPDTQPNSLLDL